MTEPSMGTASGCGQAALAESHEPASGCGQEAPTDCGQGALAPASDCGQATAAEAVSGCGQAATASTCGQAEAATSQCGAAGGLRLLDVEEMAAWRAFLAASMDVTAKLNHDLEAGAGISMHEYEILVRLSEAPGYTLRMSELADGVSHSRSRLTHTVGRLEKQGHVERFSCSSDRRGVNCRLTPEGREFLREMAPVHLDGVRRYVIERLDREELATFTALLRKLVEDDAE